MPCPFFKQGMCTSPLLGEPRSDVCIPGVCDGDYSRYSRCKFYTERALSLTESEEARVREKPLPSIHYLYKKPECRCPYFRVLRMSDYYLAECKVLDRLLTKYEVYTCIQHYNTCPLRKIAMKIEAQASRI